MKSKYWDKFYEKPLEEIPWQNVQADWFKELVDNKTIKGSSSLDLGCGTGQKSIYLAKYGNFSEVIGVDISEKAIEIAWQNAKKEAVQCQFICADATEWSFIDGNKTFDLILDWANLHGIPADRQSEYIKGINQHSRKGTLLLIRTFSSQDEELEYFDLVRNGEAFRHYVFTKERLARLFSNFNILMTTRSDLERSPKEGIFMLEALLVKS
jgi:2-polyprenyl-3-methyl-5-hydroxy-6-metoxy-1,4-benzoquinol methylase